MSITLEILEGPNLTQDEDGLTVWEHYAYTLRLRRGDQTMDTPWRQGLGVKDDPDPASVLEALLSDAAGYANTDSFEDWAEEYGYDTDSRKAEAIYRAVVEQTDKLRDFLGNDFLSAVFPEGDDDSEAIAARLVNS